jgi:hypothetical protein
MRAQRTHAPLQRPALPAPPHGRPHAPPPNAAPWTTPAERRAVATPPPAPTPPQDRQLPRFPVPQLPARRPPGVEPSTQFPIVRGSAIDGHGWSAGDTRNPSQIIELEMVARDGIEPSTRGFSVARRARLGARNPKTGKGFSTRRPNRPRRPSPYRTPRAPADRAAA